MQRNITIPVKFVRNAIIVRFTTNDTVTFTKSNRGANVNDSRCKKAITCDDARNELCRMLGDEQGAMAYNLLVGA